MLKRIRFIAVLLPIALAACATTRPPPELVSARAAYARASSGPAAQLTPGDLHDARTSLDRAERSYSERADTRETRDLAYIAERKAMKAESLGRTAVAQKETLAAREERTQILGTLVKKGEGQVEVEKEVARKAGEQAKSATSALEQERAAREAAERRAEQAVQALAKSAEVKRDPRGLVITLSGSVLFAFGKSELLPSARRRLDEVAEALKNSGDREFVVEGHTDNVGSDDANLALSQKRADAVRAYLVSRGVDASKIKAIGKGKGDPIENNASAEGRAVNRRVEVIVQPPETGVGGGPKSE